MVPLYGIMVGNKTRWIKLYLCCNSWNCSRKCRREIQVLGNVCVCLCECVLVRGIAESYHLIALYHIIFFNYFGWMESRCPASFTYIHTLHSNTAKKKNTFKLILANWQCILLPVSVMKNFIPLYLNNSRQYTDFPIERKILLYHKSVCLLFRWPWQKIKRTLRPDGSCLPVLNARLSSPSTQDRSD